MNIVVCMRAVHANVRNPAPKNDGFGVGSEGDTFINESDDYALELALTLRREFGGTVTALTLGPVSSQEILYASLAKGADSALRIDADEFDPNVISLMLARAVKNIPHDLVLAGIESADSMSSQIGISLGARLGLPYVFAVTKVSYNAEDGGFAVTRELGGGAYQILEVAKPAVLCVQSGIAPLTYTPVVKLIHARRKAIPCILPTDLGIDDETIARHRGAKFVDVSPCDKNNSIEWLSGNPAQLAAAVIEKISKAL